MKSRSLFLLRFFFLMLALFLVQKVLFVLYNMALGQAVSFSDLMAVLGHALSLDATTSAYLSVVPFLSLIVSLFFKKFPLRKVLAPYFVIVALLTSIIFCADAALYPFWGFKLDATVFNYIDSPKDAFASVSPWFVLAGIVIILLLASGSFGLLLKATPKELPAPKRGLLPGLAQFGWNFLFLALIFITMRGGLGRSTANIGKCYFSENQFLNHAAVNPDFSLFYSLGKQEDFASQYNFLPEEEKEALIAQLYPECSDSTGCEMLLSVDKPNVLLIILEGFGGSFVEELDGVPDVSPNLKRLSDEGVFFTNCYAGSFRTDRGTVCILSGFPGLPTTSLMKIPAKSRTLPSLAQVLADAGYATDFLYGGDINFTNMKSFLLGHGYQHVTADVDFSPAERSTNAWGVTDEITFDFLFNQIQHRGKSPWHTAFLTLASHEPFEVPYHRLEEPIPNAFAYTDSCLGDFVDRLKQTPAWDSLLIVCLPDHGFCYPRAREYYDPRNFRIPILWLGGAVKEPRRIDKIMSQTDLANTLLSQLRGCAGKMEMRYSRNVLSGSYRYPFAFFTFNDGLCFVDSAGATVFDNKSRASILNQDNIPDSKSARIKKGQALLQHLYDDLGRR